jgi:outer membrane receptor protein involved in Fe transport
VCASTRPIATGGTPIDLQREEVGIGTVALDYRGERFRIALDAGCQHQDYLAPLRYATLGANIPVPTAPNTSANFHAPWTRVTQDELFGVVRSKFDLAPGIPDWTRFDVGARYLIARPGGKPIILRAAIENLFDENYRASTNGARLTIGAPRSYLLSTTFQF